ncbi:maleate cis-trans isomerase family protein [Streptacidiphilus anmyonensis]|uniref:maleate cis-trans isomerase family protein n=1 Tax=Streptacidiphilus anmyonensis TaxID=405782 RepID=UPI0005AA1016|nr:arylmalonate decarboxylase [Streptacidiphilus anmyonensis]
MDIFRLPRLGLVVPPENPIAEPEFNRLIGAEINVYSARFPVTPEFTRETMEMYNEVLPDTLADFGRMNLDAAVIACNASHYLLDPDGDRAFLGELSQRFGFPVQSSSRAILALCEALGVGRMTLVSPYDAWLTDLSRSYWEKAGLTVDRVVLAPGVPGVTAADDRFNPYLVTTQTLLTRLGEVELADDAVVLFTGTGMGTLPALAALAQDGSRRTLLTSNLASAWWTRRTVGADGPAPHPLLRRLER